MDNLRKILRKLDDIQRHRRPLAFMYAVIKKYGEDTIGYQAALLTYYAFLSLFPLLLVLTTLTQLIANTYPHLQASIIHGTTSYFPILGSQLSAHVHSLHRSGVALIVGLLFTFYGARGVADVFRHGVNRIWQVPKSEQDSFPQSAFKSFVIIVVGGLGFTVASVSAGLAAAAGHGLVFRLLSILLNVFILFWLFVFLLRISLPKKIAFGGLRTAAITAVTGLVVLQLLGGYLLARELKNLDALYSYFALALGLLFWIYLQAQIIYYSVVIAVVKTARLWPRSLSGRQPTKADKQILASRQ